LAAQYPDQAALDAALAAISEGTLQGQMAQMLAPVLAVAQSDPEQLLARLAGLYPAMDDSALMEQLARVVFVAETWGRLNA
jgi:phage gp29-like protein